MVEHFHTPIQRVTDRTAERWTAVAEPMASTLGRLRDDALTYDERAAYMEKLATTAADVLGERPGWHGP